MNAYEVIYYVILLMAVTLMNILQRAFNSNPVELLLVLIGHILAKPLCGRV